MKKQRMKAVALSTVLTAGAVFASASFANQQPLEELLAVGQSKVAQAQQSQVRINRLQDETSSMINQFNQVNKVIEGLQVYNSQLERQLASQREIISDLEESIGQVTVIQRQIQPLVLNMLEAVEQFIEMDAPYRKEQRLRRVQSLRDIMTSGDVTIAEKFRQVLEIYSIEAEYARKIDTYEDTLVIDGEELTVDIFAVGRVALMYQTRDASRTGAWDRNAEQWVSLDSGRYRTAIRDGIRIAQQRAQNDIMHLPISAPEVAR